MTMLEFLASHNVFNINFWSSAGRSDQPLFLLSPPPPPTPQFPISRLENKNIIVISNNSSSTNMRARIHARTHVRTHSFCLLSVYFTRLSQSVTEEGSDPSLLPPRTLTSTRTYDKELDGTWCLFGLRLFSLPQLPLPSSLTWWIETLCFCFSHSCGSFPVECCCFHALGSLRRLS